MERVWFREAAAGDEAKVGAILAASPEAGAWRYEEGSGYRWRVAVVGNEVVGVMATQSAMPDEHEVLTLAVGPEWRRRGIGQRLMEWGLEGLAGRVFLEVRESNRAAREMYEKCGFRRVAERANYYKNPTESAIVLVRQKW